MTKAFLDISKDWDPLPSSQYGAKTLSKIFAFPVCQMAWCWISLTHQGGRKKTESGALVQSMATHAPNWGVSYCFFWSDPKVETITVRNLCLNCSQASVAFHQLYLRLRTHYSVCRLRAAWRGHQGRAMLKLSTPINRCQNSWPVGYTPKKHWGYTTRNGNARCVLELQAANPWNMMCLRPL